eukprot:5472633-Alexandrium_andersonii.AAC.1
MPIRSSAHMHGPWATCGLAAAPRSSLVPPRGPWACCRTARCAGARARSGNAAPSEAGCWPPRPTRH